MTERAMRRLAGANPVRQRPPVAPVESLRRAIEDLPATDIDAQAKPGRSPRRRALLALPLAVAGLLAVAGALTDSPSGPALNVAAAAYAATSPGDGVLEARFVEHWFRKSKPWLTLHRREWIDAAAGMRREQRTLPAPIRRGSPVSELATAPGWIEVWGGETNRLDVIERTPFSGVAGSPAGHGGAGTGQGSQLSEGIETYRRLYVERSIRLVGRERVHGRLLWKLESIVGILDASSHGRPQPFLALIVLVDPHTYLPIVQRTVDLLRPGHPVQSESDLVSYRRLPSGPASEALLRLSTEHPGAHVQTRTAPREHARRVRRPVRG
jgi:hypothetical protein